MRRTIFLVSIMVWFFNFQASAVFLPVKGIAASDIKRVALSKFDPSLIYVASGSALYRRDAALKSFKKIAVFKDEQTRHIFFDPNLADTLYVAASRNFYRVNQRLERLFSADDDNAILTALKDQGTFYLGTAQGLYRADEDSLNWQKVQGIDAPVYSLDAAEGVIYLAADNGVYSLSKDNAIERLFVVQPREDEDYSEIQPAAAVIKIDQDNKNRIWLAGERGVFLSPDKGDNWEGFSPEGFNGITIHSFFQTPLQRGFLYVCSDKGLFIIDIERRKTKQLFEGLYSLHVNWASFDGQGNMYVATDKGLFSGDYFNATGQNFLLAQDVLAGEPGIEQIQKAAIYYNEVHPEKIAHWRRALYLRGLMPKLGLNYSKTIYGTAGGATYEGKYMVGPRDWGVSFAWDIGDLIWNSYHDDIDTRSRLNTQLRFNILDDINRVYFERLRLKNEIVNSQLNGKELFDKQLRLAELTAILDGYTGGVFSKQAKRVK